MPTLNKEQEAARKTLHQRILELYNEGCTDEMIAYQLGIVDAVVQRYRIARHLTEHKKICETCKYRGRFDAATIHCNYIVYTGHQRGTPPPYRNENLCTKYEAGEPPEEV